MPLRAIIQERTVARHQRRAKLARGRGNDTIGRIFCGLPGRKDDAISKSGEISASRTPGTSNKLANQRSGLISNCNRPREASIPTSQAVIGEI